NESVIRLVEAGFSEGTIIKRIQESPVEFDLSPAKLDELFKKRVTDAIIAAMRAAMGKKEKKFLPQRRKGAKKNYWVFFAPLRLCAKIPWSECYSSGEFPTLVALR